MGARRSAWLTSRLHARRAVKRLPSKSRRSDAGDCFRRFCFLQVSIHVLDAEAKKLCVMAWWWKGRAVRGSARERRAACARAIAGARMPATELRKAGGGGLGNHEEITVGILFETLLEGTM